MPCAVKALVSEDGVCLQNYELKTAQHTSCNTGHILRQEKISSKIDKSGAGLRFALFGTRLGLVVPDWSLAGDAMGL